MQASIDGAVVTLLLLNFMQAFTGCVQPKIKVEQDLGLKCSDLKVFEFGLVGLWFKT